MEFRDARSKCSRGCHVQRHTDGHSNTQRDRQAHTHKHTHQYYTVAMIKLCFYFILTLHIYETLLFTCNFISKL